MRNKQGLLITSEVSWKDITPGGMIFEAGCAKHFVTGDWRIMKPVFNADKCKHCLLCVPACPDSSIPVHTGKRYDFDLAHCKGCGICAKICPFSAIDFIKDQK